MAITQESDSNSKKLAEGPVQHCGGEGADPGLCRLIQQRKSDGPSTRPKSIGKDDCGVVRSRKLGGNRSKDILDQLSDIDDVEVVGYLRTKEEMHLKRVLWEAMNEGYVKISLTIEEYLLNHLKEAKKQKQAAEKKKAVSVKKATKTTGKVEPERRSSRINYDALKSLYKDSKSCESVQTTEPDSYARGSQSSPHENSSHGMHGSNESWYDEDEHDNETFGNYEDENDYQYSNEEYNDDDFDS